MKLSLTTLHEFGKQEVFDTVVKFMLSHTEKLTNGTRYIHYHLDGKTSALGSLISEEEYDDMFEHICIVDVIEEVNPKIDEEFVKLLLDLQLVEDYYEVSEYRRYLADMAEEYGLTWSH